MKTQETRKVSDQDFFGAAQRTNVVLYAALHYNVTAFGSIMLPTVTAQANSGGSMALFVRFMYGGLTVGIERFVAYPCWQPARWTEKR
jgi:hypothetical protein